MDYESETLKEYYNIDHDVSFVNARINGDIKCFIDPAFLQVMNVENFDAKKASKKVRSFFSRVLTLYTDGDKEEALKLFTAFQENNAFGLGYSLNAKRGRGLSKRMVMEFFDHLFTLSKLQHDVLLTPAIYQLFIRDFNKDRFTDLLTTIIAKELWDYSILEATDLKLPLSSSTSILGKYWDGHTFQQLIGRSLLVYGNPVILVPFSLLTKKYAYTIERFLSNVVYPAKQAKYADEHDGKIISVKELKKATRLAYPERGYLKSFGIDEVIKNPNYLVQFVYFINVQTATVHSVPLRSCDDVA